MKLSFYMFRTAVQYCKGAIQIPHCDCDCVVHHWTSGCSVYTGPIMPLPYYMMMMHRFLFVIIETGVVSGWKRVIIVLDVSL